MNLVQLYQQKQRAIIKTIEFVSKGQHIITSLLAVEPYKLMKRLEAYNNLQGNRFFQMLSANEVLDIAPDKFKTISMFMGACERKR